MATRQFIRFNFCGEVYVSSKKPLVTREFVDFGRSGKAEKISLNFAVKDNNNRVYVSAQDFKNTTIKTIDTDNNPIEIDWNDRFDQDVIDHVAGYRKYVVNLGERKEFITKWDFIEYLESALAGYVGDIVVVGNYTIRPAKGKYYENYDVNSVYSANEDGKRRFKMVVPMFYSSDSIDMTDMKTTGDVHVNAYVPMWINKDEGEKMVPFTAVLSTKVYDLTNPAHVKMRDYKLNALKPKPRSGWASLMWECAVINGNEEIQFDESCLTAAQKEQIELGLSTLEDFRPRGSIFGNKISQKKLVKPVLMGEYADGIKEKVYTDREFEELIYIMPSNETVADMLNSSASADNSTEDSIDPADLF